jgi:Trk K+ transport system NAD-binding subunit
MALVTYGPHKVRIYIRYVGYLLWEFRLPLGVFVSLVFFGGLALHHFYRHEEVSYARAFHAVFLMVFLESGLDFPDEWYLQPFFFLVPIIGLGAVADSVVRLAFLMFTQKQNLPEWQRMVASLYRKHIVVVGVGKVGYQIIKELITLRESVVAVDMAGESLLIDDIRDLGVPLIHGNARYHKTLEQAGVAKARAVILATNDDLANLDSALTARDINPKARIVLRLFDETLARKIEGAFTMPGISTAHVSAPAFIAAATGRKVYQHFQLAGRTVHLTDMLISPEGGLVGRRVGELQADKVFNVVMHQGPEGVNLNPNSDVVLGPDDTILVIAPMERLLALEAENRAITSKTRGS